MESFINRLSVMAWIVLISGLGFYYGKFVMPEQPNAFGVYMEWVTVGTFINYYLIANQANTYYSSITLPGKLITAKEQQ